MAWVCNYITLVSWMIWQLIQSLPSSAVWLYRRLLSIGKTPVRIILWCPTTKMLIKVCFLIQPLEQEGMCQTCCISLCSKVFMNHLYQMKASPECLNILIYWSKYWVTAKNPEKKSLNRNIFCQQIYRLCLYSLHQVAHIDCSPPSGKQHEILTGVWAIESLLENILDNI